MILWFSGLLNKFSVSRCLHRRRWPVVSRKDRRETRKIDRYSFLQSNSAVSEDADRCQSNCSLGAECEWYSSLLRRRLWSLRGVVSAWSIMAGQVVCWYCPKKQIYLEYHDLDVKNMNIGPGEAIEMVWIGEKSNQMNRRQKIDEGDPKDAGKYFWYSHAHYQLPISESNNENTPMTMQSLPQTWVWQRERTRMYLWGLWAINYSRSREGLALNWRLSHLLGT